MACALSPAKIGFKANEILYALRNVVSIKLPIYDENLENKCNRVIF